MSAELLKSFTDVQSIFIVGRRWFDSVNGNTYHTSEIYVNDEFVHKVERTYGYGDQYVWNSFVWLKENKYINCGKENPSIYCRENNIKLNYTVSDVKRKKDL